MSVFRVTLRCIAETRSNEDFTAIMLLVICFSRQTHGQTNNQTNQNIKTARARGDSKGEAKTKAGHLKTLPNN